jgi:predicted glutamine amidotransferase
MCRLTAYLGPEIPLENIIVKPQHSLLIQSKNAEETKLAVNGDGFGVAWYTAKKKLGLFKDILPAWSDDNLPSLCQAIESSLFLAHVRASTTGTISRENCHPFTHANWAFMHNGAIGDFPVNRRQMESTLCDKYYCARTGNTDSELLFLMLLNNDLQEDPKSAIEKTINQIWQIRQSHVLTESPVRMA